jgi:hypothetical protein
MIVAPIVMAAISNTPPTISHRIGLPLTERGKLNEALNSAVIGRRPRLNAGSSFPRHGASHGYDAEMEAALGS